MLSGKKNISVLFLVLTLQNDGQVKVLVNSSLLCLDLRLSGLVPTTTFARVWSTNSSTGSWSFSTSEPQPTQGTTDTPTSWGSSTNTLTKSGHSKADPIFYTFCSFSHWLVKARCKLWFCNCKISLISNNPWLSWWPDLTLTRSAASECGKCSFWTGSICSSNTPARKWSPCGLVNPTHRYGH